MEMGKDKTNNSSLFNLARETLKISLLKLRLTTLNSEKNCSDSASFSFPELVERIKLCKGIEVLHLISALPHSGLRPDLLELLEHYHPMMGPFLEKFWKEVCSREFPRVLPDVNESWPSFYKRQVDSSKSKILAAGSRLRDSYRGEEKKVHQLQTISVGPSNKRARNFSSSIPAKKTSLMEKSRQQAMNSSTRNLKSPSKSGVTFRMRQPSQKR